MDVLAYILNNPETLPLWLTLAFAVGMYPFGMLFQCSKCCQRCECESGAELPETITATLSGFTDYTKHYLCDLTFQSCYGTGAIARAEAPGQAQAGSDPTLDRGPISDVTLLGGGSGYAKFGRAAPTVTVAPMESSNGTGVTFTATLTQYLNDCKIDEWKVTKVTGKGGTLYQEGEMLQFTVAAGDTEESPALAVVHTLPGEPTLTLSVVSPGGGSGAVLEAVMAEEVGTTPKRWFIDSVTVVDGGDGYGYTDSVQITVGENDSETVAATLKLDVDHDAPTVQASVQTAGGVGASLAVSLASGPSGSNENVTVWSVQSVAVIDTGSGYEAGDTVEITVADGYPSGDPAAAYVSAVDEDGGIVAVEAWYGGEYFKGGPITAVVVEQRGVYHKDTGEVESVEVLSGGIYYRIDETLPPYVAEVTVGVSQTFPSDGSGASFSVTIDEDPESETFGQITAVSIDDGGDGYLAWQWTTNDCCGHYLNGVPIVLTRLQDSNANACNWTYYTFMHEGVFKTLPVECIYATRFCGGWESPFVFPTVYGNATQVRTLQLLVGFTGEGQLPIAELRRGCGSVSSDDTSIGCTQTWMADSPTENCAQFEWSASNPGGATIAVTQGGSYDPEWRFAGCAGTQSGHCGSCSVCCQGDEPEPDELEITWQQQWQTTDFIGEPSCGDVSGTYVLPRTSQGNWYGNFGGDVAFGLSLIPGHCACLNDSLDPTADKTCCEQCIKKCTVHLRFIQLGGFASYYLQGNGLSDARYEPHWQVPKQQHCETCHDTPICGPPAGLQIPVRAERITTFGLFTTTAGTITI